MSFALGLAVFGGALAVTLRAYLIAAADEARDLRVRIALESAAASVLGELAAGSPVKSRYETAFDDDHQTVSVTLTGTKVDPASDSAKAVEDVARAASLVLDPDYAAAAGGLADLSIHSRLSSAEEDRLRQFFTYGRGGAPRIEGAKAGEGSSMRAGDQVDLRAQSSGGAILWVRARITGGDTGWLLHDYRRLRE